MAIRKIGLGLFLSLLLVPAFLQGRAQDAPAKPQAFQDRIEQLKVRLQLTPEQVEQVRPVLAEEVRQLQAIREKYDSGEGKRRTRIKMGREMRGVRDAADEKLRRILSKRQMDELKAMRKEARDQFRDGGGR
jgi:hypothetical protein